MSDQCEAVQAHADNVSLQYETLQIDYASVSNDLKVCREDRMELKSRMLEEATMMVENELLTQKMQFDKILEGKEQHKNTETFGLQQQLKAKDAEAKALLAAKDQELLKLKELLAAGSAAGASCGANSIDLEHHFPTRVLLKAKDSLVELAAPLAAPFEETFHLGKGTVQKLTEDVVSLYSDTVAPTTSELYQIASDSIGSIYNTHVDPLVVSAEEASGVNRAQLKRSSSMMYDESAKLVNDYTPLATQAYNESAKLVRSTSSIGTSYLNSALDQNPSVKSLLPSSKTEFAELGVFGIIAWSLLITMMYVGRFIASTGTGIVSIIMGVLCCAVSILLYILQIPIYILTCGQCRTRKAKSATTAKPKNAGSKKPTKGKQPQKTKK